MSAPHSLHLSLGALDAHVLEWPSPGAPSGPTTLLLHGYLDLAWSWTWFVEAWAPSRRLLAPDFRGHGDSGQAPQRCSYTFQQYIGDLYDLVEGLGEEPVDLIAHSMGGMVASYFAGAFPDRVRRMVLVEGTGPPDTPLSQAPGRLRAWSRNRHRAKSPRTMTSVEVAASRLQHRNPRLPRDRALFLAQKGTRAQDSGVVWKHDPRHLLRNAIPYTRSYHEPFLAAISCPVLLVNGADSAFVVPDRAEREALIEGARVEFLEDCGHMVHHDQPEALAKLVDEFLGT